jgi:hypothetical protein
MLRKAWFSCMLLLFALVAASALDLDICPYLQAGTGQAGGSFLTKRGDFYSELGAASYAELGSSAPYYAIFLGSVGVDLALSNGKAFLWKGPFTLAAGIDGGAWGGAVKGRTAGGTDFATTRARSIVVSIHADERYRIPIGPNSFLSINLGPLVGFNCGYIIQEDISGISSRTNLSPALADVIFLGAGLGLDYGIKLWRGHATLGLRSDLGITNLSSADGALGDSIALPWRVLARIGYEIPLGAERRGLK